MNRIVVLQERVEERQLLRMGRYKQEQRRLISIGKLLTLLIIGLANTGCLSWILRSPSSDVTLINTSETVLHDIKIGLPPYIWIENSETPIPPDQRTILLNVPGDLQPKSAVTLKHTPLGGLGTVAKVKWIDDSGLQHSQTTSLQKFFPDNCKEDGLLLIITPTGQLLTACGQKK